MILSKKKAFQELLSLRWQKESDDSKGQRNNLEDVLDKAVARRKKRDLLDSKPPMPAVLRQMQESLKYDCNAGKWVLLD